MSAILSDSEMHATETKPKRGATASLAAAPAAHVGSDIDRVLDDVFLTPRVLDRAAFERFASTLTELIRRAGAERLALETVATQTQRVGEDIKLFQTEHPEAFEKTTGLVRQLSERAAQASAMIEQAGQRSAELDRRAASAVDRLRRGAGDFEGSVRTMLSTLERRLARVEQESDARVRRVELMWRERVHEAEQRAMRLEQKLSEIERRAEAILERPELDTDALEAKIENSIEKIATDTNALVDTIAERIERARSDAEAVGAEAERRVKVASDRAKAIGEADLDGANAIAESVRSLVERGEALRGSDGVEGLIDRAHEAGSRAEFAQRQYTEIASQADHARRLLGESIVESTELIDSLLDRQDKLREGVEASLNACTKSGTKLTRERNKMQKALDEAIEAAQERADTITKVMHAERESLDLSGQATKRLLSTARETVELLRSAIEEAQGFAKATAPATALAKTRKTTVARSTPKETVPSEKTAAKVTRKRVSRPKD